MIHRMQATEDNNRPQNMPGRMSATEHEIGERKRLERERKKKNIRHSMFTHYVSALTHHTHSTFAHPHEVHIKRQMRERLRAPSKREINL